MKDKLAKYLIIALALAVCGVMWQCQRYGKLQRRADDLEATRNTLLDSVTHYKTRDGLNAAQVSELRLTMEELKKYRAEDVALIKQLQTKGRDVERYYTVETITHDTVLTVLRDSVIIREPEKPVNVRAINIDKKWYSLHGWIDGDSLNATLKTRSALSIVETVKYKRFLGFLWKTNKVKDRHMDVTSQNPNEEIIDINFVVVDK